MCHLLPSAPAAPPLGSATDWAEMVVAGKSADGELPVDIRDASWTPHYNSTATFSRLYVRGVARVWGPDVAAPDGNFPHDWGRSANKASYTVPPLVLSCGTYISHIPPSPPSTCRSQSATLSALDQRSQMAPTLASVRMARRWPFTDCLEESVRGWSPARISRFRDVLKEGKV